MVNEKRKQLATGIIFSYALIIIKLITGLVYTPLVLQSLGQTQYGVYSLVLSLAGYLTIFDSGTNAAYIRFYVQTKEKKAEEAYVLNTFFLIFFIILSSFAFIVGIIISNNATSIFGSKITANEYLLIKDSLKLLSISLFFEVFNCLWNSIIIANEKFIYGKLVSLLTGILMPIITVPLLLAGHDCRSIIFVRLIISLVSVLCTSIYCIFCLKTKFLLKKIEKRLVIAIFQFIIFIVLQSIMDQFNWQIDKLILSWFQGTKEISVYSVGSTFNSIYMTLSSAIASVFIAEANRLVVSEDNDKIMCLFVKISRLCTYITLSIMIEYTLIGKHFIYCWAGEKYEKSYIIGFLLMFPLTFSLSLGMGQDITRAKNKHHRQVLMDFSVCVVNVIASIPLAFKWGAIGSAIGTFFSELLLCCIIQPLYYNYAVGIDMKYTFGKLVPILKGCVFPIVYGMLINYFGLIYDSYFSVLTHGFIIFIIYFLSNYLITFNDYEKEKANNIINKFLGGICKSGN